MSNPFFGLWISDDDHVDPFEMISTSAPDLPPLSPWDTFHALTNTGQTQLLSMFNGNIADTIVMLANEQTPRDIAQKLRRNLKEVISLCNLAEEHLTKALKTFAAHPTLSESDARVTEQWLCSDRERDFD